MARHHRLPSRARHAPLRTLRACCIRTDARVALRFIALACPHARRRSGCGLAAVSRMVSATGHLLVNHLWVLALCRMPIALRATPKRVD